MKSFKQFISESYQTTMVNGHPMIDIDGEFHHTHDSSGKPIHSTEEGIRNFHKWFGKSRTVDEHGRPRVFYHGTSSDIPKFDLSHTGKGNDEFGSGFYLTDSPEKASSYASTSSEYSYTGDSPKTPNVIPAYVSIKKPIDKDSEKPLSIRHLHSLITSAPNHHEALEGFGDVSHEGYHRVLRNALDAYKDIPAYHAMYNISNDFYSKNPVEFLNNFKKITKYDGVISDKDNVITAFSPNQIKSSVGNTGRFHKKRDEITETFED